MTRPHLFAVRGLLAGVALAALSPVASLAQGRPDLVAASLRDPGRVHVPDELLVQFRPGASDATKAAALRGIDARLADELRAASDRTDGKGDLHLVKLPPGLAVAAALRGLPAGGVIDFAEPNWVYRHQAVSNDTFYTNGQLWGMYGPGTSPANAFGSQAAAAWGAGHTCNPSVVVGVIDEGVMFAHADLAANIWANPFDAADGLDNDGNGLADDVRGWDFAGNDGSTFDGVGDDHGTHVAGTIAGHGGNGVGVAGVCWRLTLVTAKFLGNHGGTTANAIRAVDYLTDLKTRHGMNIVATNNSWGGGGFSQALQDAIERANRAEILFVAAAGNASTDNDASPHYPSSYPNANVIAVAAIDRNGALAGFSNFGARTVHLGAPGAAIVSTVPARAKGGTVTASYATYSGTSMATPHVTGAAALYATTHPGATAAQIKAAILAAAVPTPSLAGRTITGGRLNVSGF
ncbi:MAG TPA: S8 family peptidase [Albitalea sp.]